MANGNQSLTCKILQVWGEFIQGFLLEGSTRHREGMAFPQTATLRVTEAFGA
jgi:hypothetical protein